MAGINTFGTELHPTQAQVLTILKDHIDEPLTIRELQDLLDISSPSVVHHHIKQLEKKKYLRRNPSNPRDYQIIKLPHGLIHYINLYGMAQCGPEGTILSGAPINRVPISTSIYSSSAEDSFLVKARGESMEPKIQEDDLLICKKQNIADDGDTIVGTYEGKAIVKRYYKAEEAIFLQSYNNSYEPIIITPDCNFKIEGIVKVIISTP